MSSDTEPPKVTWRIAQGPPQEKGAPFRRSAPSYASVAAKPASPKSASPPSPTTKEAMSRGKLAFLKGGSCENEVSSVLTKICDAETGAPLLTSYTPSDAPAEGEDAIICWKGEPIGIEVKNSGTSEGGQRAFVVQNNRLEIPDLPRNRIHRACLPSGFVPFQGRIPSFKKGDLSLETWEKEWGFFRDERIRCSPTAISDFYRAKGSSYIQIQGLGLFHTGADPCGWGVPLFVCPTCIRIRCKTHKGKVPTTVQAALNYNRKNVPRSPYCLVGGPLPPMLKRLS